jgi:methylated-DNA-[protein]-cysteine S-methyltransferase
MDHATSSVAVETADLYVEHFASPIGTIVLVSDDTHLRVLEFAEKEQRVRAAVGRSGDSVRLREARGPLGIADRLERYFGGELTAIDDIPVRANGTAFEQTIWDALRRIPVGTTTTYGTLAVELGYGIASSRAVGLANGSNPIALVVPCHRVIGANGNLTGYGGGMHRKRWLLQHEGVLLIS